MAIQIDKLRTEDARQVFQLLEQNRLPPDGLQNRVATTLVARRHGSIVGSAALEAYPDGALLRSVAVAPELQGQGVGRELTGAALRLAQDLELPAVYLLTTTAEGYFPKFGFEPIARADVPASVRASIEFTSACPSTAIVMRKVLKT